MRLLISILYTMFLLLRRLSGVLRKQNTLTLSGMHSRLFLFIYLQFSPELTYYYYLPLNHFFSRTERDVYYCHREKAFQSLQDVASLAQDAIDQAKLLLPNLLKISCAISGARQLLTHLTAVLNDGYSPTGYFDLKQYPRDSNLTMNILLLELNKMEWIPQKLYYQLDNCWGGNKNQHVIHFLVVLVRLEVFKQVSTMFV